MALFNMPQLGAGAMPAGLFGGGQMPGAGAQATQALLAAAQPRPPVGAMPQGAGGIPPQYLAALAMLLQKMGRGGAPFGMAGGTPAQAGMPGGQMGMPQMPLPQQGLPLAGPVPPPMVR